MKLSLAGESVELMAEKALWWPAARTLFIADLHLGKAASFRALGQPVPSGTTQDNLDRLSALIDRHAAARLVFLGDFLHAAAAQQASVLDPVRQWRARQSGVHCLLVRGNHDGHAGDPPADLQIDVVDEPWSLGPFAACHHPQRVEDRLVLAGHLHPTVTLNGLARDRQRLPAFSLSEGLLVLPAFGAFTGGSKQPLPVGTSCFAAGGGRVWQLPAPRRPSTNT